MKLTCQREMSASFIRKRTTLAKKIIELEQRQMKKELLKRLINEIQADKPYQIIFTEKAFSRVNGLDLEDGGNLAKNATTLQMSTISLILLAEITLKEESAGC